LAPTSVSARLFDLRAGKLTARLDARPIVLCGPGPQKILAFVGPTRGHTPHAPSATLSNSLHFGKAPALKYLFIADSSPTFSKHPTPTHIDAAAPSTYLPRTRQHLLSRPAAIRVIRSFCSPMNSVDGNGRTHDGDIVSLKGRDMFDGY
jgi:hypothetical protein